jgi:4-amino-4-deoxy-L-arabinose transferase-like glycosyltransferase
MSQSAIRNWQLAIRNSLWLMVATLLVATAFRFLAIDSAPPGWRDDELIEFDMDRRIADGWRPLFIPEAEGHEPVYHYLHAGTILAFGDNIVGYKWLPLACGLLTIALTYALARKMFGVKVALLAAALMAVSFWPVMYSRFGVRHIGVLPWMLGALYLLYPSPQQGEGARRVVRSALAGLCLAAAIMTYFAGRAVPLILIGFLIYLLVFNRTVLRQVWWQYLLAIGIAVLIALPMFGEIANTPGGEKRTEVVGGPLIALRQGNLQPAIDTTLGTLGMFTFAGDPEWLYNVENRPIFDWVTGLFFYLGVIVCLVRLKRIESGFALVWLIVGIAPAFVSIPAASFSHTIAALPVVYVLTAFGAISALDWLSDKMTRWQDDKTSSGRRIILSSLSLVILSMLVGFGAWLTIRDYFGTWANEYIVRFQYHAPTREVAKWLNQQSGIDSLAIGTNSYQLVLDPLALKLDMPRDIPVSWFNAESALATDADDRFILTQLQQPGAPVQKIIDDQGELQAAYPSFEVYRFRTYPRPGPLDGEFDGGRLVLRGVTGVPDRVHPGDMLAWRTTWSIAPPLSQPRLKLFLHVLNDRGEVVAGDDREDFNFSTLNQGDRLIQISQVTLLPDLAPGEYQVEVGWYNPDTGERLKRDDGSDRYLLAPLEVVAP